MVQIGQEKLIQRGVRFFRYTSVSADAALNAAWADTILAEAPTVFPNGKISHEVAGQVLDDAELTLLDFLVLVV